MWSEGPLNAPNLRHIEIEATKEQIKQLRQNCMCILGANDEISFGPAPDFKSAEDCARQNLVRDMKREVKKIADSKTLTKEDFLNILNNLSV